MPKFIVTKEPEVLTDYKGDYVGMAPKKALFYSKEVGRQRMYRRDFENPGEDFVILTWDNHEDAQVEANYVSDTNNETYKVEEYDEAV